MMLWLTIPPLLSIPLSIILIAFGGESGKVSVGAPLWVLLLMLYFSLSMLYVVSIRREAFAVLTPVQLASQGIMVCLVSLEAGSPPITPWLGVTGAVAGIFMLIHFSAGQKQKGARQQPEKRETASDSPATSAAPGGFPFPSVVTDGEGTILYANAAFEELTDGKSVKNEKITSFFIPGEPEILLEKKKFTALQKAQDNRFYFLLIDEIPQQKKSGQKTAFELFDSKTGFYSRGYAKVRIAEELSRANRYRRWLCGILLKIKCTSLPGLSRQEALEETFLIAYCQFVRDSIRNSDMGFFMGGDELLILLPETPQQGAKDVSLKLVDLPEGLAEMKKDYPFTVDIEYGFLYYSGNYPLQYDQFMEKLYSSLGGAME